MTQTASPYRLPHSPLLRASTLLLIASLIGNGCAYLFNVVAGRFLGPSEYGSALALIALLSILAVPTMVMQTMAATEVSRATSDSPCDADAQADALHRLALLLSISEFIVLVAVSVPLTHTLDIRSNTAVIILSAAAAIGVLLGTVRGIAQGKRQFARLSIALAGEPILRLLALLALLAGGYRLDAPVIAFFIGYSGVYVALRASLRIGSGMSISVRQSLRRLRQVLPYASAITLSTVLYNVDVLIARITLSPAEAGIYGAGAVLGRAVFFLGAAAGTTLLPLVAGATSAGTRVRYLIEALAFTAGVASVPAAIYLLAPGLAITLTFGGAFRDLEADLWRFGIAMFLYTTANLALSYLIAIRHWRFIAPLLSVQLTQLAVLATWHGNMRSIATAQIAVMLLANVLIWPMVIRAVQSSASEAPPTT